MLLSYKTNDLSLLNLFSLWMLTAFSFSVFTCSMSMIYLIICILLFGQLSHILIIVVTLIRRGSKIENWRLTLVCLLSSVQFKYICISIENYITGNSIVSLKIMFYEKQVRLVMLIYCSIKLNSFLLISLFLKSKHEKPLY